MHGTIVLLHGGALSRAMWQPQIEALGDEYNISAIDLPGHGSKQGQRFTLAAAIEAVERAIDESGANKVLLAGLSLGGYVAMAYAAQHGGRIAGLLLSGCCVQYFGRIGWLARLAVLSLYFTTARRFHAQQASILGRTIAPGYVALLAEHRFSLTGARDSLRAMIGIDFCAILNKYQGPVIIMNGEQDTLNRQQEPALARCARDCETATIPGAGHVCNLEQPERFTETLRRFADRVFASAP